jgi:hypothetical protein
MSSTFQRELRSPREIRKMRTAGLAVWHAHQAAARILKPGVTTAQINAAFADTFRSYEATPLFLNYGGGEGGEGRGRDHPSSEGGRSETGEGGVSSAGERLRGGGRS